MKFAITILLPFLLVPALFLTPAGSLPGDDQAGKEIGRTTEKELKVVLTSSFGDVLVEKGDHDKMIVVQGDVSKETGSRYSVDYEIRNRVGYADLILGEDDESDQKSTGFRIKDLTRIKNLEGGKWDLKFSDAVPISFDLKLGVGRGSFDLSGLQVKDFNLSTGATDVHLEFDEQNKATIDNLSIESGVSKFDGRNLCNANFRHFHFQGGVGTYRLDFGGKLSSEVDVDINLGMGLMTLVVPADIGVKVHHEKNWVSRVEYPDDFHATDENEYASENYGTVPARLNIRIDSGVGSVRIQR